MIPLAYGLLLFATSASAASTTIKASGGKAVPAANVQFGQMMIQRRLIVRVPAMHPPPRALPPLKWKETKGPKCVALNQLAGAAIGQDDTVDLFLRGGTRLRARLDDDCPALDYYSGFYINPSPDGQVCQRRDMLHTRAGQQCRVERFRLLVPDR